LLRCGLSLADVNRIYNDSDIRTKSAWLDAAQKQNEIKRLQDKIDIAEAFNFAYIGSKYDKRKENQKAYSAWQRKIQMRILKLQSKIIETVWGKFGKSRRM
jgi:hypothetical protein